MPFPFFSGDTGRLRHPFHPAAEPVQPVRGLEPAPISNGWHTQYLNLVSPHAALPPDAFKLQKACAWQPGADQNDPTHVRWPLSAMPLTILMENTPQEKAAEIMQCLRQWEVASIAPQINPAEPLIRFQRLYCKDGSVGSDGLPSITLRWEQDTVLGRDYEVGHTRREVDAQGHITHVSIVLIENPRIDARLSPEMRRARLEATILHEFGHALGLEHSQHAEDVMHYRGWQNTYLTPNDIAALHVLYARRSNLIG